MSFVNYFSNLMDEFPTTTDVKREQLDNRGT